VKINLLFPFWLAAIGGCWWIMKDLQHQSGQNFFGTAETESRTINFDYPVLIQKIYVATGEKVKQNDTLAVLFRTELDRRTTERKGEIYQVEVDKTTKNALIDSDESIFEARQATRISELQAQIKVLQSDITIQNNLKEALFDGSDTKIQQNNPTKYQQIAALEESIHQVNQQTDQQRQFYAVQRKTNMLNSTAKIIPAQNELSFLQKEKNKLVLLAPMDGFIEQILVANNEMVQSYREMFKMNPQQTNKVIGFVHESIDIRYNLGDTVQLASSLRPKMICKGVIVGTSPKLVELPIRLRKMMEVKAWGREVYIKLPENNGFYIGEKVMIDVKEDKKWKNGVSNNF
jgi:multidrug efflux pump subunit AcrA (membrane-fusion protein)